MSGLRGAIPLCIPSSRSRKVPIPYDKALYRQRHRIENKFFGLKDCRRITMRYDRLPPFLRVHLLPRHNRPVLDQ